MAAELRRVLGANGRRSVRFETEDSLARAIPKADVLVNATPVGSWPDATSSPLPHPNLLHPGVLVVDLVYRPRRTQLLRDAAERGCKTVQGVEMLIEQGARSFTLWTGCAAPVDVMRRTAYLELSHPPMASSPEPRPEEVHADAPFPHPG